MRHSFNSFIRKNFLFRDVFYVKYGLKVINFAHGNFARVKNYFASRYPESCYKEKLYDIFGRDSHLTNFLLDIYKLIYSSFDYITSISEI